MDSIEYTLGGMSHFRTRTVGRLAAAFAIAALATAALTGCSSTEKIDMTTVTSVIDVRTPAEVATGHLEGAIMIDIEGADFAAQIDALDHAGNYVVYCRSGNRAGQAVDYMKGAGFTGTLINAGSVADASVATGLAIVQ